jgi:hypothetical protein
MGTYQISKCGHCKKTWASMEYLADSSCGPSIIKCVLCDSLNLTRMKLYRDMTFFKRFIFWLVRGIVKPIFGLFMLGLGIGFLYWQYLTIDEGGQTPMSHMFEINNWFTIIFFNAIAIGLGWLGILNIRDSLSIKMQINQMEKLFDKNGGYLWSNQEY